MMQVHDVVRRPAGDDIHLDGRRPGCPDVRLVASLLDGLGTAALVFGPCGEVLHESTAFAALARREPDALLARHAPAAWLAGCGTIGGRVGRETCADVAATDDGALRLAAGSTTVLVRNVPLADVPLAHGLTVVVVEVRPVGTTLDDVLRDRYRMTRRERSVAAAFGAGSTLPAIAASLGMSAHTARHHLERIYQKLGVNSRTEAVGRLREVEAALQSTPFEATARPTRACASPR